MDVLKTYDDRIGLESGKELVIKDGSGINTYRAVIIRELGRGSNCIVYKGHLDRLVEGRQVKSFVVIKELFPKGMGIKRGDLQDSDLTVPEDRIMEFDSFRERFGKRFISFSEHASDQGYRTLPEAFIYGTANKTVYAIGCPVKGSMLSEADISTLSLNCRFSVMEAVCRALGSIHIKEKLYLDLKPGNILYDKERDDLQALAYIIDYDTVQDLKSVRSGLGKHFPFTYGWAPPEQMPDTYESGYKDQSLLGYHTDIYSVGALFFYLLTGRSPNSDDIAAVKKDTFDWRRQCIGLGGVSDEIVELIKKTERPMLEPDPVIRSQSYKSYLSVRDVEKTFAKLYGLTAGENHHFEPIHDRLAAVEKELKGLREGMEELRRLLKRRE